MASWENSSSDTLLKNIFELTKNYKKSYIIEQFPTETKILFHKTYAVLIQFREELVKMNRLFSLSAVYLFAAQVNSKSQSWDDWCAENMDAPDVLQLMGAPINWWLLWRPQLEEFYGWRCFGSLWNWNIICKENVALGNSNNSPQANVKKNITIQIFF